MIYSKTTPWFDISIDEKSKQILIEQRWRIYWSYGPGSSHWTDNEKERFIHKVQKILKHSWGKAFKVQVNGASGFARQHRQDTFPIISKIYPSTVNWHWKVIAGKALPTHKLGSYTTWGIREIIIYQNDVKRELKPAGHRQRVVAHEIGHALGNLEDEYNTFSDYLNDKRSIMSNGMVIRKRHLNFILAELNTMIQETSFYL